LKILNFVLILFFCALVAKFCNKATDGFSILGIKSERPFNPVWETTTQVETSEVEQALSQPYHYLASGSQCFVFASQDRKYVIKFFRQRIYSPSTLLNHLPLPPFLHRYREKKNWKRADKCTRDFESYKLAFDELREETKLLYVHLNPTTTLHKKLLITDKLQIQHEIALDPINFVLQRRAEASFAYINRLMQDGKQEEAKKAILSMRHLIKSRCAKGFKDRDPDIRTNCGFVDGIAVKLDVGRLEKTELLKEPAQSDAEIEKVMAPFNTWLETFHPNLQQNFY
jgi:hypothetical protein